MGQPKASHPAVAIGHVQLRVGDVRRSATFFATLGLRPILQREGIAILELRGGTHLLLLAATRRPKAQRIRGFDFMVDDVAAYRDSLLGRGYTVSDMQHDKLGGHHWFEVSDPDGHRIAVYSTHAGDRVV